MSSNKASPFRALHLYTDDFHSFLAVTNLFALLYLDKPRLLNDTCLILYPVDVLIY